MGEVANTFGQIIGDLQRATGRAGGVRFGRFGTRGNEAASMLVTLDKEDFALATGRMKAYQHIPYYTGLFVLNKAGHFLIGKDGPVQRAFDTEKEPGGAAWEALSDADRWWRRTTAENATNLGEKAGNPEGNILDYTGELKKTALSESQMMHTVVTGKYARLMLGPEHLEGDLRFKFFTQQMGSSNGWGMGIPIPARPFFPDSPNDLTKDERDKVSEIIKEGIKEGVDERAAIYGRRRF